MPTVRLSSATGSLDASFLESPISTEHQERIVSYLWGSGLKYQKRHLRPYFQYYTEQCRTAFLSHGSHLVIRTHQNIIDISSRIQGGCSRPEVKEFVQQCQWTSDPTTENAINASIDLTVRLLYMLDVGEFENAYSGRKKLLWAQGFLQDFLPETLSEATCLENDGIKLDGAFKVCNLVRIAGFRVEPTSNLCDHLRLRDVDKTVEVFYHALFLIAHRQYVWQTPFFYGSLIDTECPAGIHSFHLAL